MITKEIVEKALRKIKDPELNINIYDLGLIYKLEVLDNTVNIDMTLTFPGCPFGPAILEQTDEAIRRLDGVEHVNIDLVWAPPWSPEMIAKEVREVMGIQLPE
jgi:metal-sulfur cluster biosynthetic enzyme